MNKIFFSKIIYLIFICLILMILSCSNRPKLKDPEYIKISDQITAKTVKQITQKKHLRLIGVGGELMYDVNKLGLSFNTAEVLDIARARELIVYCTELYLKNINEDYAIRPFLRNYPFLNKNINISIFSNAKITDYKINIAGAAIHSGKVTYYIRDKGKHLTTKYIETYEEALKITKHQCCR